MAVEELSPNMTFFSAKKLPETSIHLISSSTISLQKVSNNSYISTLSHILERVNLAVLLNGCDDEVFDSKSNRVVDKKKKPVLQLHRAALLHQSRFKIADGLRWHVTLMNRSNTVFIIIISFCLDISEMFGV